MDSPLTQYLINGIHNSNERRCGTTCPSTSLLLHSLRLKLSLSKQDVLKTTANPTQTGTIPKTMVPNSPCKGHHFLTTVVKCQINDASFCPCTDRFPVGASQCCSEILFQGKASFLDIKLLGMKFNFLNQPPYEQLRYEPTFGLHS